MKHEIFPDDFYCPKCGKTAQYDYVIGTRKYSNRVLNLPYLTCAACRLCSYSKKLLRYTIKLWHKYCLDKKYIPPLRAVHEDSYKLMEETLDMYVRTAGYKRIKKFARKKIH